MPIKFEDSDTEKIVLASCLKGADYWRNIPSGWFKDDLCNKAYKELQKFLKPPYQTYPTPDLVFEKCEDIDVKLLVKEISTIKIKNSEIGVKVYDLFEMYAARKVYDLAQSVPNDLEKSRVEEVVRAKMRELAELVNPFEVGQRKRGFIYESASARWNRYRSIEQDPSLLKRIPYGISELDKATSGGSKPSHITLFFAKSGGFKSKVKANIAYNTAFEHQICTMVVTLEIPFDEYEQVIDSRNALLPYDEVTTSNLNDEDREKYRQSLKNMTSQKPPLYLVDIPGDATTADLVAETERFYIQNDRYPDILLLDYINEIDPLTPWGTSTGLKFKNVGVEIRKIARSYKWAFIGSMQENRKATEENKNKEKVDLQHIGESNSFHNVCHVVVHLYQDEQGIDEASNQLHWSIKKNRYGPKTSFTTFANPKINYIGDRRISFYD
jgi:replicative DNA helicase